MPSCYRDAWILEAFQTANALHLPHRKVEAIHVNAASQRIELLDLIHLVSLPAVLDQNTYTT